MENIGNRQRVGQGSAKIFRIKPRSQSRMDNGTGFRGTVGIGTNILGTVPRLKAFCDKNPWD